MDSKKLNSSKKVVLLFLHLSDHFMYLSAILSNCFPEITTPLGAILYIFFSGLLRVKNYNDNQDIYLQIILTFVMYDNVSIICLK